MSNSSREDFPRVNSYVVNDGFTPRRRDAHAASTGSRSTAASSNEHALARFGSPHQRRAASGRCALAGAAVPRRPPHATHRPFTGRACDLSYACRAARAPVDLRRLSHTADDRRVRVEYAAGTRASRPISGCAFYAGPYAISARGFNNTIATVLVLIDVVRTVYRPRSGVFW